VVKIAATVIADACLVEEALKWGGVAFAFVVMWTLSLVSATVTRIQPTVPFCAGTDLVLDDCVSARIIHTCYIAGDEVCQTRVREEINEEN
jgi:hypothetical protein